MFIFLPSVLSFDFHFKQLDVVELNGKKTTKTFTSSKFGITLCYLGLVIFELFNEKVKNPAFSFLQMLKDDISNTLKSSFTLETELDIAQDVVNQYRDIIQIFDSNSTNYLKDTLPSIKILEIIPIDYRSEFYMQIINDSQGIKTYPINTTEANVIRKNTSPMPSDISSSCLLRSEKIALMGRWADFVYHKFDRDQRRSVALSINETAKLYKENLFSKFENSEQMFGMINEKDFKLSKDSGVDLTRQRFDDSELIDVHFPGSEKEAFLYGGQVCKVLVSKASLHDINSGRKKCIMGKATESPITLFWTFLIAGEPVMIIKKLKYYFAVFEYPSPDMEDSEKVPFEPPFYCYIRTV